MFVISFTTIITSEPAPPAKWSGYKVKSRSGSTCEWGDAIPGQCFGLGPERFASETSKTRLTAEECKAACCKSATCTMWQHLPDRGCFYSGGDNYCDQVCIDFVVLLHN